MTKNEIVHKYKAGFTINGKHPIETEEWLLSQESTENKLIFQGYDANMLPFPEWKIFDQSNKWHRKRLEAVTKIVNEFDGNVYMDNVCVSDIIRK